MNIDQSFYQNSLARHPINFFSIEIDKFINKYNQKEGSDHKISKTAADVLNALAIILDVITAPIRLTIKTVAMAYSKFYYTEAIENDKNEVSTELQQIEGK
jgi:hypothetical protein